MHERFPAAFNAALKSYDDEYCDDTAFAERRCYLILSAWKRALSLHYSTMDTRMYAAKILRKNCNLNLTYANFKHIDLF